MTTAQEKVAAEVLDDLQQATPMSRLVQGDVGSGKTVVAAIAALQAIAAGKQVALMAPTEILAEQHFVNFKNWLAPLNIKVSLLSGKQVASERKVILSEIADGTVPCLIGTHALFQEKVIFKNLALIIIDEQHRFGVAQRLALRDKGAQDNVFPHQLLMTATPIPRSLAMTTFGDPDFSAIDELPPGRTPINTIVLAESRRQEIINRIAELCKQGRQVYWVCSLITESEVLECQAAEKTYEFLQQALPDFSVALVHGQMKAAEKQDVMQQYKNGVIKILVATTVIEVGVDVPNANLMIIENAERLGLSQLHQLRGRVGRGSTQSYCVLMYKSPLFSHGKTTFSGNAQN